MRLRSKGIPGQWAGIIPRVIACVNADRECLWCVTEEEYSQFKGISQTGREMGREGLASRVASVCGEGHNPPKPPSQIS
jgi:hypothetical protein